jgi:MFS family permease
MFKKLLPFWLFLTLFKFGAGLQYTLLAPLGAQVFPIWLVGIIIGAGSFLEFLFDVPGDYLLDLLGYKRLLAITTVIFLVAVSALFFGLTKTTFLVTVFVSALGWLFFTPGSSAYLLSTADEKFIGRSIAYGDVFKSLGIVLGSAVLVFVLGLPVPQMAVVLFVLLCLALASILLAPTEAKRAEETIRNERRGFFKGAFETIRRLRPASFLLLSFTFSAATFYAIVWFVVPIIIANEIHSGILGLGLGVFDFSIVVLGFALGKLVDSYEKRRLILFGIVIFSVFGMLLGFNFGILFLLLGFLATAGDELTSLSLWSWLYGLDKDRGGFGLITGIIDLADEFGWTVGPVLAGIFYTLIGPTFTIAFGGFLILTNILLFIFLAEHTAPTYQGPIPKKPHRHRHRS